MECMQTDACPVSSLVESDQGRILPDLEILQGFDVIYTEKWEQMPQQELCSFLQFEHKL
jgi:hypothetical protein